MPDNNQTNTSFTNDIQAPQVPTMDPSGATADPTAPTDATAATDLADKETPIDVEEMLKKSKENALALMPEIASKIADAHNILIALSSDPSVDEMAAAIGLSLYLDRLGKRATAIYSGSTPNALEFLRPDETFDTTADTLQDFVIALNKEKADHLRYKLDGDYVKIFITPYRSRIAEEDLEFSYGDFNIDLVLALDVANGVDLDAALREHGRIMHDASIVNITTGNPGKFGEIEWSDKSSSSISEMVARLIYSMGGKEKVEPEEATAFLTGIVAATDRFTKGNTYPDTMRVASDLLESGADQQLVAKNIAPTLDNQFFMPEQITEEDAEPKLPLEDIEMPEKDKTALDVLHPGELKEGEEAPSDDATEVSIDTSENAETEPTEEPTEEEEKSEESSLLDELKATAENIAAISVTTPDAKVEPVRLDEPIDGLVGAGAAPEAAASEMPAEFAPSDSGTKSEKVIAPSADLINSQSGEGTNKYSDMIDAALNPTVPDGPLVDPSLVADQPLASGPIVSPADAPTPSLDTPTANPALSAVPNVPSAPEINGIPDIDFVPPAPIQNDQGFMPPVPPAPTDANLPTSLGPQPAMQDQVYNPQASAPDAFKIPGM